MGNLPKNTADVLFNGQSVEVVGGFHHVQKGYMVEICKFDNGRERKSVSFSELHFPSPEKASDIFLHAFKINPLEARQKGHSKGVPEINMEGKDD